MRALYLVSLATGYLRGKRGLARPAAACFPESQPSASEQRPGHSHEPKAADSSSVLEVSALLRDLKANAGKTFRDISEESGYSLATLTAACRGDRLPSWSVTQAFVNACRGDEQKIRELYTGACKAHGREVPGPDLAASEPPTPANAATPLEFVSCMRQLRLWAGNPSLATLNARSSGYLPRSTVSEALRRETLPRLDLVSHFVQACHLPGDRLRDWEVAWKAIKASEDGSAASADHREDRRQGRAQAVLRRWSRSLRKPLQLPWPAVLAFAIFPLVVITALQAPTAQRPASTSQPIVSPVVDAIGRTGHSQPYTSVTLSQNGKAQVVINLAGTVRLLFAKDHAANSPVGQPDSQVPTLPFSSGARPQATSTDASRVAGSAAAPVRTAATYPVYSFELSPATTVLADGSSAAAPQQWDATIEQDSGSGSATPQAGSR